MALEKLLRLSEILSRQRHLSAIRRGMLINVPVTVIGSMAVMVNNLPYDAYQRQMRLWFGADWHSAGQSIANASLAIMSLLLTVTISYSLAQEHHLSRRAMIHPLIPALLAVCCLMILEQPFGAVNALELSFTWLGLDGIFLAVLTALISTELFLFFSDTKAYSRRFLADAADATLPQALGAILPVILTLSCFLLVRLAVGATMIADIYEYIYFFIQQAFSTASTSLAKITAFSFFVHMLWLLGLHGNNILQPILDQLNVTAVHVAVPDGGVMLTKAFFDSFVLIGGTGSTLCLGFALLISSRRRNIIRLAALSLLTGFFNINEILLLGLPVVLNPIYMIPFLLVPFLFILISYLAIAGGLTAPIVTAVNWTTPPLANAYMATGSWSGVALQLFNILLGILIYLPFVRLSEKQQELAAQHALTKLIQEINCAPSKKEERFLSRQDTVQSDPFSVR